MGCGSSNEIRIVNSKPKNSIIESKTPYSSKMIQEHKSSLLEQYTILKPPLGKGLYDVIYRARNKITGQIRAVKCIQKSLLNQEQQHMVQSEVEILKELDHPNIIQVLEFYQDNRNFYIVTEYCSGGELYDRITDYKQFTEREAANLMIQILSALNYCHEKHIVHRNLKPENILFESLSSENIRVSDFGTSVYFDPNNKMQQRLGSPYYIAPEVLDRKYNEKCDLWACGVILYILLSGYPPFNGEDDYEILQSVRKAEFSFEHEYWDNISEDAKTLITDLFQVDYKKRLSAKEALQSKWITKFQTESIEIMPQLAISLNKLKSFRIGIKLQQASLMFMINCLATREDKKGLLKQFQALDLNNDGKISKEELRIGYQKVCQLSIEDIDTIMDEIDKDGNGFIDYSEFILATINKDQLLATDRLVMAFRLIDKDNSGFITKQEFKQAFCMNTDVSDQQLTQMIQQVDLNFDGQVIIQLYQISFEEFKTMMLQVAAL